MTIVKKCKLYFVGISFNLNYSKEISLDSFMNRLNKMLAEKVKTIDNAIQIP
jgi:hypothetical protein